MYYAKDCIPTLFTCKIDEALKLDTFVYTRDELEEALRFVQSLNSLYVFELQHYYHLSESKKYAKRVNITIDELI